MWALAAAVWNANSGVTSASNNNICRLDRVPHHQAIAPGSWAHISTSIMAHKGMSGVEQDASGHLRIRVADKPVEVAAASGVSDSDIRSISICPCMP